jgi:hypothetical protein
MNSCQSPRKVLHAAHRLACQVLPDRCSKFARLDGFTLPQLFACLVIREFYGLGYRRTEKLLADSPQWLADLGLTVAPDHNTLWRAFGAIVTMRRGNRMLDRLAASFARAKLLRLGERPLALDSTCFERRHRSWHYDRRCRQMQQQQQQQQQRSKDDGGARVKRPEKPGKYGASVNASRRRRVSALPKLSVAVAAACHLILAATVRLGNGSDSPDFDELLYRSWARAPVKVVVADAGYDAEHNHRIARMDMGVRSIIPPGIGRPTKTAGKLPSGRWRRHMAKRFSRKADKQQYGQRSQAETVHSMVKRNQGSALRSRTPERQKKEMLLRVLTHNIVLLAEQESEE